MRRALISDIHGNLEALEVVLDDIKAQGLTEIFCLGDIIGYGPNPCECIDRVMDSCAVCLLGNHDQGAMFDPEGFNPPAERAIFWTRSQLEAPGENRQKQAQRWEFLSERPRTHKENGFLFVHGSARNPLNEYVFPEDIYNQRKMDRIFALVERYCFQGHTHVPGVFTESLPGEAFQFYAGPVDGEGGPLARLNSWPLDPDFIQGIVADDSQPLNFRALARLNQADDPRHVTTGWHAVEFLLWGEDGGRAAADFVAGDPGNDRRRDYLAAATQLLVNDLSVLVAAWAPGENNYRASVESMDQRNALGRAFNGMTVLLGYELPLRRIGAGLFPANVGFQQSPYSDTSPEDNRSAFDGARAVYYDTGVWVWHHVSAERLHKSWFYRRVAWDGLSQAIMLTRLRALDARGRWTLAVKETARHLLRDRVWRALPFVGDARTRLAARCRSLRMLWLAIGYVRGG